MSYNIIETPNTLSSAHLQIVGEFRSAGVARVHGDEHSARGVQAQFRAFEQQLGVAGEDASLDGQDLLRHHWQHLQVDTVELVEAGPSSTRCQTLHIQNSVLIGGDIGYIIQVSRSVWTPWLTSFSNQVLH